MKTKRFIIAATAIVLVSAGAIALPLLQVSSYNTSVGEVVPCGIFCNGNLLVSGNDDPFDASGNGNASFLCTSNVSQAEADAAGVPVSASFTPVDLTISGDNPQYGTFSFSYDPSRTAPETRIVANQQGSEYPATSDVYANVKGTISGLPGVYINSTTCHITNANLRSFNPHENEVYTFAEDVVFTNIDLSQGERTFTIPAGATITLN